MSETEKAKAKMSVEYRKKSAEKKNGVEGSKSNRESVASMEVELVLEEQVSGALVESAETESQPIETSKEKPKRRKISGIFKKGDGKKEKTEDKSKRISTVSQDESISASKEQQANEEDAEVKEDFEESPKEAEEKAKKRRSFGMFKKKDKESDKDKAGSVTSLNAADDEETKEKTEIAVEEEKEEEEFKREEAAEETPAEVADGKEKKQRRRRFSFSKKKKPKVKELDDSDVEAEEKDKQILDQDQTEKPVESSEEKEADMEKSCQVGSQSEGETETKPEDEVKEEATEGKETEPEEAPKRKKSLKRRLSFSRKKKAKKTEEKQDEGEAREGTMDDNEMSQQPELVNQSEAESQENGGACAGDEKTANELASAESDTNEASDTEQTESEEESGYFRLGLIYSIFEAIFRQKDKMPEMSVTKSRELVIYTVNQGYIRITDASGSIFTQASQAPRRAVMWVLQLLVKKYPQAFKNLKKRKSKKSKGTSDATKEPVTETHI
ncbi:neurofilament medium polypeptide [Nematostella vectensis]|uniref:neurofilament medium polypeptide n=1 Tax=Nematostella vectensis TaxID=45351 RepID=UPI0020772AAA|nr:neurofilament medium polypeptide [Nematostella vectensis]